MHMGRWTRHLPAGCGGWMSPAALDLAIHPPPPFLMLFSLLSPLEHKVPWKAEGSSKMALRADAHLPPAAEILQQCPCSLLADAAGRSSRGQREADSPLPLCLSLLMLHLPHPLPPHPTTQPRTSGPWR
jgi:hypothetical protein